MEDQLISLKTAKLAKEVKFKLATSYGYIGKELHPAKETLSLETDELIEAGEVIQDFNKEKWVYDREGGECFGCKADNIRYFIAHSAPNQSLLQRWLRELHNVQISLYKVSNNYYYVIGYDKGFIKTSSKSYGTYESALEDALQEGLKFIKKL